RALGIEGLRGRYIVLPNVSQGGNHTVLTDGAHADFRRMPYVGGYLDQGQTINTVGAKNRRPLSGEDKTWSSREQVAQLQQYIDDMLSGNLAERSKLHWLPWATKWQAIKDAPLKDDFDEWLARVVMFAFSLPPDAFIKQRN